MHCRAVSRVADLTQRMGADGDRATAHRRAVDRAIDRIFADLTGPLDLAAIAADAGYSKWHFQRIFTAIMGESPATFVARTRLERAVALARAEPGRTWKELAWEVGFATPQQLSREFARRYGKPARAWDRSSPLVDAGRRFVATELGQSSHDVVLDVHIEHLPATRFAYLRVRDPYTAPNLEAAWHEVATWRATLPSPTVMLGMSWDDPATVPAELCRYDIGLELDATVPAPSAASERWMPSTTVAMVRVDGDLTAVEAAWEHLHRTWLPASSFRSTALPAIERYTADPQPDMDRWVIDCILPITPAR